MILFRWFKQFFVKEPVNQIPIALINLHLVKKGHKERVLMPESFDLEQHLVDYPPAQHGFESALNFQSYKVNTFFFLLTLIPSRNSELIDDRGYVPVHMAEVKKSITDIHKYIAYLANTNVIEVNRQYSEGKSRRYKWHSRFDDDRWLIREVETRYEDEITRYPENSSHFEEYPYLFYWYRQHQLNIDNERAVRYATIVKNNKMADTSRASWSSNKNGGLKHPLTQYKALLGNMAKLEYHIYEPHIDNTVYRLHSVLTNLQKEYRNFITYNGQALVNVDIKNSQPYLVCLLLKREFWEENSSLPVNIYTLPESIKELYTTSPTFQLAVQNFFASHEQTAFQPYIQHVTNGTFYEEIIEQSSRVLSGGEVPLTRDEAKLAMLALFFSKNSSHSNSRRVSKVRKLFTEILFPEVAVV